MPSYTPMHQGTICAKVYPEGIQSIKGNNCGLISDSPYSGGYIVGGHIHTDRTTYNIEDPQQKYRLKNRATVDVKEHVLFMYLYIVYWRSGQVMIMVS